MKKVIFVIAVIFFLTMLFAPILINAQATIHNPQQIGQTGRNQKVSRGFEVASDTALFNSKIWIPGDSAGVGKVFTSDANGFGAWAQPTGAVVTSVTKSAFLALDSLADLEYPTTYQITDIENGLYLNTYSDSLFTATATMYALLPTYIPSGQYLGQYHSYLGEVENGQIYTWGEWNYINDSVAGITPAPNNSNNFDSLNRFRRLSKSEANYYTNCKLNVLVDNELNITFVEHALKLNSFDYYFANTFDSINARAALASINLNNTPDNYGANRGVLMLNCRVENTDEIAYFGISNNVTNTYFAKISNCYIVAQGGIGSNVFFADGELNNIVGNVRVRKNTFGGSASSINRITTADGAFADFLHNHLNDNNRIEDITVTGEGVEFYVWDNTIVENCDIHDWQIENCGVKFANSRLNNHVDLGNFTFNVERSDSDNYKIYIPNSNYIQLSNVTNISLNAFKTEFPENVNYPLDLATTTTDIFAESIESYKGFATITVDFSTDTLFVGTPIDFNVIPDNSYVTSIKAIGTATGEAGANLAIGVSTDAASLLSAAISDYSDGEIYNGISTTTTGNRSMQLTATVGDITGGKIAVLVEFMIER